MHRYADLCRMSERQLELALVGNMTRDYNPHVDALLQYEFDRRCRQPPPTPTPRATLHQAALWYATFAHIPVFPLQPGLKRPATRHGYQDATLDPNLISKWWSATPDCNIGIPTGTHFDVVDLDGWDAQDQWASVSDTPEPIAIAITVRDGGRHIFIRPTGQGNRTGLLPGVDWRGRGGYVVAPPSIVSGRPYFWLLPIQPQESHQ